MNKALRKYGIFLIIPGIVWGYSFLLKIAAGPYWLASNFDPAYQYIINGLYLLKGIVPNHTDHPGTPLQMLCCAVCWLFNVGQPVEVIVRNVLIFPERYLHIDFVFLSLFSFLTSLGLAVFVYRKLNDPWIAVLTQLPSLTFLIMKSRDTLDPVFTVVSNVSPEALLISILNLFNICFLMNLFARTKKDEVVSSLLWGFVCGWGVAVKLTFLPILVVPLIVLSWKNRFQFTVVFLFSFLLWTLPIMSKYPIIWGWISGITTHRGAHGSGGSNAAGILNYCLYWKNIFIEQGVYAGLLILAMAFVFWKIICKEWERTTFFFTAIGIGVCFQFSAVTQHPGAHYLLPGLGLFSSLLVLFYLQAASKYILVRRIAPAFILIFIFLSILQVNTYRTRLANYTQGILSFQTQVEAKYQNCTFIDYYRSSSQGAALFFGDGWNLSPHLGEELSRLYPNEFYFNIWGNSISSFKERVWSNDLLAQNACVLFRGDGDFNFSQSPYEVRLLDKGTLESIHLLEGTTEKQAYILMVGAMQFMRAGDHAKAMACLLQARKFYYQPDSSIESLMQALRENL